MINAYINQDFLKMYFKLSKRALAIDFKCKIPVAINLTIIKIKKTENGFGWGFSFYNTLKTI